MAEDRWHVLDRTLPGVAANLALDELLLQDAEEGDGRPTLRLWELPDHAVVLGASGRWRDEIHWEACRADGVPIARRSSGGGTVVIGPGALNVAVVLPDDFATGLGAVDVAQHYVLGRIADALRTLGPPVEVRGSGDLTLGLRKVSGSAQRRLKRSFLVHATILYDFDLPLITRYLKSPARQPSYRAGRPHDEFVTNLEMSGESLLNAVRSAWLPPGGEVGEPAVSMSRIDELVASKFGDPAWVERL
ncbi:MAG TPA: lipoate--protein ligase family protein [Isosphaeraceae bacterium]|jgi:lipoate-protein ligase A|nr:lipoate--protein ligase family protein [Isosphaeraceae bacterium]